LNSRLSCAGTLANCHHGAGIREKKLPPRSVGSVAMGDDNFWKEMQARVDSACKIQEGRGIYCWDFKFKDLEKTIAENMG
jgi:hypothetical protein